MEKIIPQGIIVLLISALLCLTGSLVAEAATSGKYNPVRIADEASAVPGILTWSPDSKMLAFIRKGLHLYSTEDRRQTEVDIKGPYYVSWTKDDELLVLYKENGAAALCSVDREGLVKKRIMLDVPADAVYPLRDRKKLLLFSSGTSVLRIGTEVTYDLKVYDREKGTSKALYSFRRIYMTKNPDTLMYTAWMHAGVNPLDDTFLIMEQIKPPVVMPYSNIKAIDYLTGQARDISGSEGKKLYLSGTWSPDGRRIALTDNTGHLEIRDLSGPRITAVDDTVDGLYPSWNPGGSQIFLGGYILDSGGREKENLFSEGSARSIAQWSPDGTKIAVSADSGLYLFSNFKPSFISPDAPPDEDLSKKLFLLKGLFIEGLLTKEEYSQRYDKLLRRNLK